MSDASDLGDVELARQIATRGDRPRAEQMLRVVLGRCGGSGSEAERAGTLVLAQLCMRSYRETEGLVLARRALRLSDRAGVADAAATAQNLVSAAMEALEDWDALEAEIAAMAARTATLPGGARRGHVVATHRRRAALALGNGLFADAERELAAAEAASSEAGPRGPIGEVLPLDLAEVWIGAGRYADALRALDAFAAASKETLDGEIALLVDIARARAAFGLGIESARATVEAALARLEAPVAFPAGLRRALAVATARDLERSHPGDLLVDRAYAVAAVMSVERALAIQAFLAAGGSSVPVEAGDLRILARARDRALARDPRLAAAIARGLPSSDAERSFVDRRSAMRVQVVVCAWCGRIRAPGGTWIPVQQFVPVEATGWSVSHGICDDCRRTMAAR